MPTFQCHHCHALNHFPPSGSVDEQPPVEVPTPEQLEETDRVARAYGWEIGKGQPFAEQVRSSLDNPFMDPQWKDRYIRPSEG